MMHLTTRRISARTAGATGRRHNRPVRSVAVVMGLLVTSFIPASAAAQPLGATSERSVARENLLTPNTLGNGTVDGLQYPNATEGLAMVQPPVAVNGGSAQLS